LNQKNVLVLFGGCSAEHDISISSAATVINLINRHNIIPVYITKSGKWLLYDGKLDNIRNIDWEKFGTPAALSPDRVNRGLLRVVGEKAKIIPVDVVFPVLHGLNGEDGTVQGLCELAGIPYVGCGVASSALCMDKAFTKLIARSLKIPQADYFAFNSAQLSEMDNVLKTIRYKLGYPCFIKPAAGGSSVGISKVTNKKELLAAIELALGCSAKIIAEKAVAGREIECAVLGTGANAKASLPGEIIPGADFYDYEAKYISNTSTTRIPADLPADTVEKIKDYALQIFRGMDCRGLARVDFFVEESGKVLFNEINTMPGFTNISMYPMLWEAEGISKHDLVEKLIEMALDA
jgi:D-alanine-D-alanine ligase